MGHLKALGLNRETVLIALERAAHARWAYLKLCRDNGIRVQPSDTIDHHLMNHMVMLDSLASLAGIGTAELRQAVARGKTSGSL